MKTLKTEKIKFEGQDREYDIVSKDDPDVVGAPRWFVSYGQGLPFISDEVPEQYRQHTIFHELYEFEKIPNDRMGRCRETLVKELERVPAGEIREYIRFRREVFEELKRYAEKINVPELGREVSGSLEYLINL